MEHTLQCPCCLVVRDHGNSRFLKLIVRGDTDVCAKLRARGFVAIIDILSNFLTLNNNY